MHDAYKSIDNLVKQMDFILTQAGIRHDMPTGDINRIPLSTFNQTFDFLHNLYMSAEWRDAQRAKELVPDKTWANLEIVGHKGMVEYRNLRKYLPAVKELWNPPIKFFGKHYAPQQIEDQPDDGTTDAEGTGVRSKQAGASKRNSRRGKHSVLFDQGEGTAGLGRQLGSGDPVADLH